MQFRQTDPVAVAAAKASMSAATGYRLAHDPRLPSMKKVVRGRRRPDPLGDLFETEIVPMLKAARVALDTWLADARTSGVRALETFAAGLEQDGAAIRAALTTPWSNGQAEGQITRLKLIKRQMYGRASFDLLRRRVLLAA